MKNKTLMKTFSAIFAVVMLIYSVPLSGFVGLKLPDWFSVKANAETGNNLPENAVDYSDISINQYMSKILLNYDYIGSANGYDPANGTLRKSQLEVYLNPAVSSSAKAMVDAINENKDFVTSVKAWELLTFEPSNITEDMLDEKGYYITIIYSMLDVMFDDSGFLDVLNDANVELGVEIEKNLFNEAVALDEIEIESLEQTLTGTQKDKYIEILIDEYNYDKECCENIGIGIDTFTNVLKLGNTVREINTMLTTYTMLSRLGKTTTAVIYEMYQNCDKSNEALTQALWETYIACSNDARTIIQKMINTQDMVFNYGFSVLVDKFWEEGLKCGLGTGFTAGLLIGQAIGTAIGNYFFSTDQVVEQFYVILSTYEVEKVMVETVKSLGEKFKANQSEENADNYIKSIEFLFSILNLGGEYTYDFVDVVRSKNIIAKIKSCFGKDETLEFYRKEIPEQISIRTQSEYDITNIESYRYYYLDDAPSAYALLFETPSETNGSPVYSTSTKVGYIEPQIYPEKNSAAIMEYTVNEENELVVEGCHSSSYGTVTIPSKIGSQYVKTINSNAFSGNESITAVELSDGLEFIEMGAFEGTSITSISIPKTVRSLSSSVWNGYYTYMSAFYGASELKEVIFEYGMLSIPPDALRDCESVTNVVIPDGVRTIHSHAFSGCTSLKTIKLPNSVMDIYDSAFANSGLISIELPNSVTTIWNSAFEGCENLSSVQLNEGIKDIRSYAFRGTAISSINIPKTLIDREDMYIYESAFEGADKLKAVNFEDGMLKIPNYILYNCGSVTSVTIPDSVIEIGERSFYGCTQLQTVELSDNIEVIGYESFTGCEGLLSLDFPESLVTIRDYAFGECKNLSQVTLNEGLKELKSLAFYGTAITSITIPKSLEVIDSAFSGTKLKTVIFENGRDVIPQNTINGCYSLTNVVIPEGVIAIGSGAFGNCTSLESITFPESVKSIGEYAFSECGFISIEIPKTITSIGDYAFSNCTKLSNVILNDGLEYIGMLAFQGTDIKSIKIPKTVTNLSSSSYGSYFSAFSEAEKLKTVIFEEGTERVPDYAFANTSVSNIIMSEGLVEIGYHSFENCYGLTRISIPSTVTWISSAFEGCHNLETIYAVKNTAGYNYAINNNINVVEITCPHTNTETVVDSSESCTVDGVSRVICSLCKETLSTTTVKAKGHSFAQEYIIYNETCTQSGLKQGVCSKCGDVEDIIVPPLGHDLGEYIQTKAPTETEKGEERADCSRCSYYITKEIPSTSHIHGKWVEKIAPTCTEKGEKIFYCEDCDELIETQEIPALGHDYETVITKPTCVDKGCTTYTCLSCGDSYIDNYVNTISHEWSAWKIITEPTMTEDGAKDRVCSVCGKSEEGVVPKTGITITVTDSEGNIISETVVEGDVTEYSFTDLEDGEYTVTVSKETYATREYTVTATDGKASCEFKLNHVGDVNGDGKVSLVDYTQLLRYVKKTSSLDGYAFDCADVNGDGKLSLLDYTKLLRHVKKTEMLW